MKAISCLSRLEKLKTVYTTESSACKSELLTRLQDQPLQMASHIRRLHDLLCFIRAYPDTLQIFQLSDQMLCHFHKRPDLKRFRRDLINSGIAGTTIEYRFFWPMARWLRRNWPAQLRLVWDRIDQTQQRRLTGLLPLLVPPNEVSIFDEVDLRPQDWMARLKGTNETDAVFYVSRLEHIYKNDLEREQLHDDLDLTYRLLPGPGTPDISSSRYADSRITYQQSSFMDDRADLAEFVRKLKFSCRRLKPQSGQELVDLAKRTMVTHERDLDAFAYGNPHEVSLIDFRDGYQIACIGIIPERRYLLHASFGLLTLKNGMPVAYLPLSIVFNCAEVGFNLFSAYRGAEAALIYRRNLAIAHHLFGVNTFSVDSYQLGYNNRDGLRSGVWWFYYKLGFRPQDVDIKNLLQAELAKIQRDRNYRSDVSTLNRMAAGNMYFSMSELPIDIALFTRLGDVARGISHYLVSRFGSDRERGLRVCSREATSLTGMKSGRLSGTDKRRAWQAWAPLIINLGITDAWTLHERTELARIACLKGAPDQAVYLHRSTAHTRLRKAILAFADRASRT